MKFKCLESVQLGDRSEIMFVEVTWTEKKWFFFTVERSEKRQYFRIRHMWFRNDVKVCDVLEMEELLRLMTRRDSERLVDKYITLSDK